MTNSPDIAAHAAEHEALQGRVIGSADPDALRRAVEWAFDYRGDVTLTLGSTGQALEGYLFDRRTDRDTGEMVVRIIPKNSDERVSVRISDIRSLAFTGKDTASGKSFENWMRKYAQKKLAGEIASIESETLGEE